MTTPVSLADLTNNVGLIIWAAIGATGLLTGFIFVTLAKRRSLKAMNMTAADAARSTTPLRMDSASSTAAASGPGISPPAFSESYKNADSSEFERTITEHLTRVL